MKTIKQCLQYEGGEIRPHILYVMGSEPITVTGKVSFNVFGTVRMNGIKLENIQMSVQLSDKATFKIEKDSAMLFNQAPLLAKDSGEHIEVPDVPDMQDYAKRQMHMMFEQWATERGMMSVNEAVGEQLDPNDVSDFDDDFDMEFPLDEENLVPEQTDVEKPILDEEVPDYDETIQEDSEPEPISSDEAQD